MKTDRAAERPPMRAWYAVAATCFGVGRMTKMPGTVGTLLAFLMFILFGGINIYVLLAVIALGALASDRYVRAFGGGARDEAIIGAMAGYWAAAFGLDPSLSIIVFFLFRIACVLKPFPVTRLENMPGGVGIMAGGVGCGVVVNLIVRLLSWLFFGQGFEIVLRYLGMGE
ncbi:MAG: phosphatidylglycerophosphatase A [Synergistaceae bacterium]|jgi:phosphatidylglycerophosphatase A|nr:phosphatidylglycerophosphatase A [Synergistaceae bacterium]